MTNSDALREEFFEVSEGMNIFVRDYAGDSAKVPVVCLHGYWRTGRDFEELAGHLFPGRRVIVPDLRGRGRSDRATDDRDYDFECIAGDVDRILDTLEVHSAVFVGVALGAQLAMVLANRRPELVRGIVFNDSAPESNEAAGHRMRAFSSGDEISREEARRRVVAQYGDANPTLTDAEFDRIVYRNYASAPGGGLVRDFDQSTNAALARTKAQHPDFWPEYVGLKNCPVAIVRGANSDFISKATVDRMLAENVAAVLTTVPDCGHPVMMWEPEFYRAVDELLARVEAA